MRAKWVIMSHFVWLIINEYVALIWAKEPDRSMYVMFKASGMCMLTGWNTDYFDTT